MALTIQTWTRFETTDPQNVIRSGGRQSSEASRQVTTSDNAIHDQTVTVGASSIAKLFDVAEDLADFEFLFVESSQDGLLQLANNSAANFFVLGVKANVPFLLPSSTGQYGGAVGAFDGTTDALERVYFKNTGSVSATVRIFAAT